MKTYPHKLQNVQDVRQLLEYIILPHGLNLRGFHPDTQFSEYLQKVYVSGETYESNIFSDIEAAYWEDLIGVATAICQANGEAIYELSLLVLHPPKGTPMSLDERANLYAAMHGFPVAMQATEKVGLIIANAYKAGYNHATHDAK